jgi:hypothetical protein
MKNLQGHEKIEDKERRVKTIIESDVDHCHTNLLQ